MKNKTPIAIHWFRRDLRLQDNAALFHALKENNAVLPVFFFDKNILDQLEDRADKRVLFIHTQLEKLQQQLKEMGSSLLVKFGTPEGCWNEILSTYDVQAVYTNRDYEPYAIRRDAAIEELLLSKNCTFNTYKDQVIFEKGEVVKDDGNPYTVYTPYSRKWMAKLNDFYSRSYPTEKYFHSFFKTKINSIPSLEELNFKKVEFAFPELIVNEKILQHYEQQRNFPALNGTTHLSVHLRFGTVSIRELVRKAKQISFSWLNELCWREFYMYILWHHPYVATKSFKANYDNIRWRNNEAEFQAWCEGKTGYPIVDAGMRELNTTGFMHNRIRMVVASFLTKHLLIDWRWGEAYFAQKLLDFELASNNGGWQWAAGSGCDAAPYFRIFNPAEQTKKFDVKMEYIRKWVPEFEDFGYPSPIVDHKFARERCLATYATALNKH